MTLYPVIIPIPQDSAPRSPGQVEVQREYARIALRHAASLTGAPSDGWSKDERDVPLPNAGYFWSISHKRQFAAAVIADAPIGIDIEHITERPRRLHDALASKSEWDLMPDESWNSFFTLWTAKEAVLKATGTGIADLLRCQLKSLDDSRRMTLFYKDRTWQTESLFHNEHVVAVTSGGHEVCWKAIADPLAIDQSATASQPTSPGPKAED